jgi:hypothetical protein
VPFGGDLLSVPAGTFSKFGSIWPRPVQARLDSIMHYAMPKLVHFPPVLRVMRTFGRNNTILKSSFHFIISHLKRVKPRNWNERFDSSKVGTTANFPGNVSLEGFGLFRLAARLANESTKSLIGHGRRLGVERIDR